MDIIQRLKDERRIEFFKIERDQVKKHAAAAFQDLKEAKTTFPVSDKAAYLFAYTAMLKMGRALLFLKGFRTKGEGQHETVVEAAGSILGLEFKSLTQQFDRMRRKRNKLIYDIVDLVSKADAEQAFKAAEQFLKKVRDVMDETDPQLKLKLDY